MGRGENIHSLGTPNILSSYKTDLWTLSRVPKDTLIEWMVPLYIKTGFHALYRLLLFQLRQRSDPLQRLLPKCRIAHGAEQGLCRGAGAGQYVTSGGTGRRENLASSGTRWGKDVARGGCRLSQCGLEHALLGHVLLCLRRRLKRN